MEIVGDKTKVDQNNPQPQPPAPEERNNDEPFVDEHGMSKVDNAILSALSAANASAATEDKAVEDPMVGDKIDIEAHKKDDPLLQAAGDMSSSSISKAKEMLAGNVEALVQKEHKDEFLRCLVTGERYTEKFSLFGGSLTAVIRCRSVDETDAVDTYMRRKVATGDIRYDAEYANLMRLVLITAQVQELNGVRYGTLKAPLKFVETKDAMNPPAWEEDLAIWKAKPDVIISALTGAILEFEARYWHMVGHSADVNFWKPGESTGG